MKVSLITVSFNSEGTIEQTIRSVIGQTYFPNIEYIMIDGGSTDRTLDIIKEYKNHIKYFISERDNGIYDAMNKGIRASTGDVVAILNSDDIYFDNKVIEKVMGHFINDSSLSAVYGDLYYVSQNDTSKVVRKWISKAYYPDFFNDGHVPPHPTLFVKKRIYEEIGLFNLNYKLASDYEFMLRLFKKNSFKTKYISSVFIKMRLGGATNKSILNIIKGNKEILTAWINNGYKVPPLLFLNRFSKRIVQFLK
jgi:glycosyltransferase involved in cell wall biosynthesis